MKNDINKKANEIIKLFLNNDIPLNQQLKILKMVCERIEFCQKIGAEMIQNKLELE